jgi:hypothetical protein
MRDFARDLEKAAAPWDGAVPAGERSWSLARAKLFESCQRAYFCRHYLAQGGWDQYANALQRQCFVEKQLVTCKAWSERVLNDSLSESVDATLKLPDSRRVVELARQFQYEVASRIAEGAVQLRNRAWENDPKMLHLFEFHYGLERLELFENCAKELRKAAKDFVQTDVFLSLAAVERNAWRRLGSFESFRLNGLEIWTSPKLAWVAFSQAHFLELRLELPSSLEDAARHASLLDLLAFHRFKTPSNSSLTALATPSGAGMDLTPDARSARELVAFSAAKMAAKIRADAKAHIEDFPKSPEKAKCALCRFQNTCAAT